MRLPTSSKGSSNHEAKRHEISSGHYPPRHEIPARNQRFMKRYSPQPPALLTHPVRYHARDATAFRGSQQPRHSAFLCANDAFKKSRLASQITFVGEISSNDLQAQAVPLRRKRLRRQTEKGWGIERRQPGVLVDFTLQDLLVEVEGRNKRDPL